MKKKRQQFWLKGEDGVLRKLPLDLGLPRTQDELQKELLRLYKLYPPHG